MITMITMVPKAARLWLWPVAIRQLLAMKTVPPGFDVLRACLSHPGPPEARAQNHPQSWHWMNEVFFSGWNFIYLNWLKYIEILYIRIYYVENYWNILKYHSMEIHGNTIQCSGGYSMVSFLKPRYCTTVAGNICTACWHLHPLASRLVGWHNKWPGNSTCTTVRILSNSLHQYHWMSSDNTSLGLWNSFAIHVFRHVFRCVS